MAKKRKQVIQKFGEMRYGQWFQELRDEEPRIFIKLQNVLPSGIPVVYDAFVGSDYQMVNEKGEPTGRFSKAGEKIAGHFNAVDIDGIPGCCPDWLEFELIEPPFKQKQGNHNVGRNMKLPRYDGDTNND